MNWLLGGGVTKSAINAIFSHQAYLKVSDNPLFIIDFGLPLIAKGLGIMKQTSSCFFHT